MTLLGWIGILVVILTVVALAKRWETRLVLSLPERSFVAYQWNLSRH